MKTSWPRTIRERLQAELAALDQARAALGIEELPRHGDRLDLALELGHVDQAHLVAERVRRRRSDTALALERLERGEYGRCTACGGTIPSARLRARPEATTCVQCQAALERAAARGETGV